MAPSNKKRKWSKGEASKLIDLIKKQKIEPTNFEKNYILRVYRNFSEDFGFLSEQRFIENYKRTLTAYHQTQIPRKGKQL